MKQNKFIALLAKKFSNGISAEENKHFEQGLRDEKKYGQVAAQLEAYLNDGRNEQNHSSQLSKTWIKIAELENGMPLDGFDFSGSRQGLFSTTLFKVAAILVLVVSIGLLSYQFLYRGHIAFDTLVASDQKIFKVLDDGTSIWLNKKSTLTYNKAFGKAKREISLNGEAFFDVAKNTAVPLIVHVGGIDIEVKGTAFNVNAYTRSKEIQVGLIRGAVVVSQRENANNSVLLKPNDKLIFSSQLGPNETGFQIVKLNPSALLKDASWVADTLTFNKEKLHDLAVKLEKKYDIKIEIRSEILKEKRFSGTFTNETIQQALQALKLSFPLTYTISDRLVVIKD